MRFPPIRLPTGVISAERSLYARNSNVKQCIESFGLKIKKKTTIKENTEINYKLIEYAIKIKENKKKVTNYV